LEGYFDCHTDVTAGGATPAARRQTVGTLHVVDPSPLNWLFITWNTMEEPIRTDHDGRAVYTIAESHRYLNGGKTLELSVRKDVFFQNGEALTAHQIKLGFDEMQRWEAPHPPGTWLNFPPETVSEIINDHCIQFHFPEPDGLALAKMRGFHIPSTSFWTQGPGFGYAREGSGNGNW
jgi:ABC-type transport system substrate-binding protein